MAESLNPREWPVVEIGGKRYTVRISWGTIRRCKQLGIDLDDPIPDSLTDPSDRLEALGKMFAAVFGTKKSPVDWEELMDEIDSEEKVAEITAAINEARKKVSGPDLAQAPATEAPSQT